RRVKDQTTGQWTTRHDEYLEVKHRVIWRRVRELLYPIDIRQCVVVGVGMDGYVYIVHAEGTDLYKVGRAKNPWSRLPFLQVGCPHPLTLVAAIALKDVIRGEQWVHQQLQGQQVTGEWFRLTEERIRQAVVSMRTELNGKPVRRVQRQKRYRGHPRHGSVAWVAQEGERMSIPEGKSRR